MRRRTKRVSVSITVPFVTLQFYLMYTFDAGRGIDTHRVANRVLAAGLAETVYSAAMPQVWVAPRYGVWRSWCSALVLFGTLEWSNHNPRRPSLVVAVST